VRQFCGIKIEQKGQSVKCNFPDEIQLFGVCSRAAWARLDRKGVAFGGAVQAVTSDAVTYVGGLRRFKAQVNNDNGAVPIWEQTGEAGK
jgi:hypothetical protein